MYLTRERMAQIERGLDEGPVLPSPEEVRSLVAMARRGLDRKDALDRLLVGIERSRDGLDRMLKEAARA